MSLAPDFARCRLRAIAVHWFEPLTREAAWCTPLFASKSVEILSHCDTLITGNHYVMYVVWVPLSPSGGMEARHVHARLKKARTSCAGQAELAVEPEIVGSRDGKDDRVGHGRFPCHLS